MTQFRIKEASIQSIKNDILIKTSPIVILVTIIVLYLSNDFDDSSSSIMTLLFTFGMIVYVLNNSAKKQASAFNSYIITIDNETISREKTGLSPIFLAFNEISEITKKSDGSFLVQGVNPQDQIIIPKQIDNYESLEKYLSEIRPIKIIKGRTKHENIMLLRGGIGFLLFASIYFSKDKITYIISGIILMIFISYSSYQMSNNKNAEEKIKKWSFLIIPTVAIFIIKEYIKRFN